MAPSTSPRRRAATATPAVAIPLAAPVGERLIQCAVVASAAWLSAQTMAIEMPKMPEMPKVELPKIGLPKLELPTLGGKKKEAAPPAPKKKVVAKPTVSAIGVKVRAAATGPSATNVDAPTLAELTGKTSDVVIGSGEGWKRFPARRMPGANMGRWKEIAKDITPDL